MSEFWGTLLTFLPLLLIVLLANLAERARTQGTGTAASGADAVGAGGLPSTMAGAAGWEAVTRLPSSLTDLPDDEPYPHTQPTQPTQPTQTARLAPAQPAAPDGTIFAVMAYMLLGIIYALAGAAGMLVLLSAGFAASGVAELPSDTVDLIANMNTGLMGWGLILCSVAGVVVLLRPVRQLLARFLPIDPLSTVHAVALSFIMLVLVQIVLVVGIGLDNMATMLIESAEAGGESGAVSILGAWFTSLMMLLFGALGVGWLVRRTTSQTLLRLGIVAPSVLQVVASIGIGFLMAGVIMGLEWVSIFFGWGVDEAVSELTDQMLGGLTMSIAGVLTIGLAAGIGEEALMRGAVQPRLGLLLTSVTFALMHANYGITLSTLAVLIVGLALGLVRIRMNTTSAMIVHATYNIIFGLIAYFSAGAI